MASWYDWLYRTFCPARYTAARIDAILHMYREQDRARPVQTSAPNAQYVFDL